MIIVLRVVVAFLLAVAGGLADVFRPGIGIERRHALFGELEVVGAIEETFLRLGIARDSAAVLFQNLAS